MTINYQALEDRIASTSNIFYSAILAVSLFAYSLVGVRPMPAKLQFITHTKWGFCYTNRTTALVLVVLCVIGDSFIAIKGWLILFGAWIPPVDLTHDYAANRSYYVYTCNNTVSVDDSEFKDSFKRFYVIDAIIHTICVGLCYVPALYGLLRYRSPIFLVCIFEYFYVYLTIQLLFLATGISKMILHSCPRLVIPAGAWIINDSVLAFVESKQQYRRVVGAHVTSAELLWIMYFSNIITTWMLCTLLAAAQELRQNLITAVPECDAADIEYNHRTTLCDCTRLESTRHKSVVQQESSNTNCTDSLMKDQETVDEDTLTTISAVAAVDDGT